MIIKKKNSQAKKVWTKLLLAFVLLVLLALLSTPAQHIQASSQDETQVNIYFFWGEGCPHCAQAHPVLKTIAEDDPRIGFYEFEVYNEPENIELFTRFGEVYGFEPRYVPTIFINDRYWEGWSDSISSQIQAAIDNCLETSCPDIGQEVLSEGAPSETETSESELTPTPTVTPTQEPIPTATQENGETPGEGGADKTITLPFIGSVDLSNQSLLISTLIISFVDGFNPCSIWVLTMLLAITLNARSRKKVLIIGFVFIFVTGLIYALFIGGLFTIFKIIPFIGVIQIIVALVAFVFAIVNIKDYFWYKEGISFTISDEKKPGIYKNIRRIMNANDSLIGLIGGTILLAAGVSLVEFSCTAGFPVLWTSILNAHDVNLLSFLLFLLAYMIVYQIDELGIFLVSVLTLRQTKLEEKHGRVLKLIGGMLMLSLAIVMLVDPTIMNNLNTALLVFVAALGFSGVVLLVHRVILPKFNIYIGSEKQLADRD